MSIRKKVVFLPYDFDTAIGINNEGALVFSYNLEDTDQTEGGADVYNGQQSVLWNNLRRAYGQEIKSMYQTLRSTGELSYSKVENMFEAHQSKWPEAIFNEDAWFKYLAPLIEKGNASYLSMLQGSKAEQRKWWLYNRFRYIDSKYNAGDALTDTITVRGYAKADITITPYADVYASVKYGSYLVQTRAARGQSYTLICPLDSVNDTEIYIYSASQLASVGDLSGLMVGYADFSNAIKLQDLKLGDSAVTYSNGNLTELYLGNNTLLHTLDVRNCPNLAQPVDISGCSNIENVYFDGTSITGLSLPNGGVLKKLHVPSTMTNLTIINQPQITEFVIPDSSALTSLRLENVSSALDSKDILSDLTAGARVRLIGLHWEVTDASEIYDLYDILDAMRGLDEYGNNVDTPQVSGSIHTDAMTGADIAALRARYRNIEIRADHTTCTLTYMTYDGSSVVTTETIYDGGNGTVQNNIQRAADARYTYTPNGWSTVANGNPDPAALTHVVEDKTIYAAYDSVGRKYTVKFYNDSTLLQTVNNVLYGGTALYTGATPTYTGENPEDYEFSRWEPSGVNITGNTNCYAVFRYTGSIFYKLIDRSISGDYRNENVDKIGDYAFQNCSKLTTVDFPAATSISSYAFHSCTSLTTVDFHAVTSISSYAFHSCTSLTTVDFPAATSIGGSAFHSCTSLTTVDFPAATSIGGSAFQNCSKLTTVDFPAVTSIGDYAFYSCTSLTTVDFPAVTSIGGSAFQNCSKLTTVDFPAATSIGGSAFHSCTSLTTVDFPAATSIGGSAFQNCSKLTTVDFPAATSIGGSAFQNCSKLTTVDFPAATSIGSNAFRKCSKLTTVIFRNTEQVATLINVNAFDSTPNAIIYVPDALVNDYKSATNWSTYASRIKGLSKLPTI